MQTIRVPSLDDTGMTGHTKESPTRIMWRRFLRNKAAVLAVALFIALIVLAVCAPWFQRHPPNKIDLGATLSRPSADHWLGTDSLGRDIWSRLLHGGRVSLAVGLCATLISTLIGVLFGALAGYYGGWVDMLIMRVTDIVMTFPSILVMLTIAALAGPGLEKLILIIGGLSWPAATRLVRAQFLSFKSREFVEAARAIGASDWRIMTRHILPNTVPPLLAQITFQVGNGILTEAGLSFLGMGIPMPTPSWGNMLEPARSIRVLQDYPWVWMPSAVAVLLTVLCINFIGDGLRDVVDSKMQA